MTVLDAYAVIAFLRGETCADEVDDLLRTDAVLTSLNAAEVVDQLVRIWGRDGDDVEGDLALLGQAGLRVMALDAEAALAAGRLRAAHYDRRICAISMADCVAAVAAVTLGRPLATSDPALAGVLRSAGGAVVALADSSGRRP